MKSKDEANQKLIDSLVVWAVAETKHHLNLIHSVLEKIASQHVALKLAIQPNYLSSIIFEKVLANDDAANP